MRVSYTASSAASLGAVGDVGHATTTVQSCTTGDGGHPSLVTEGGGGSS